MLLCEVALGNIQEINDSNDDRNKPFDTSKYQSRKAHGRQVPDPRHTITRKYGLFE